MRLPKIFVLDKDLEEKTNHLLEEQKGRYLIDKEAEELFPNFIDYLKGEYEFLYVQKVTEKQNWVIKNGSFTTIGFIEEYTESDSITSMYGYKAGIIIRGKHLDLTYRAGYHCYDGRGRIILSKNPVRYDREEIPFP